ncbi:carbohydrate-binding protein [Gordoniibacillus kamchatkensis]|uniref:Carbohydrate-binding protein n=1 Tax=Gordoniibacillus kamchatkensis TaxID=1590651 RepID=A0ABR5ABT0_9BACL|nr:DUF4185 domain-containing protein [Paenibacillus sp. VKM B-2647]KIL38447.1 carbohydrate-binding protein [Paenibacillus sp. VKM B-2647]
MKSCVVPVLAIACLAALGLLATSCRSGSSLAAGKGLAAKPGASFVLTGTRGLTKVAQLTGAESINHTDKYNLYGADLGSMFNADGKTFLVFGDSFGKRSPGQTGGGGADWRSNTLAFTSDSNPSDGLTFDGMITDASGGAKELLPSRKVDNDEMTVIPTHGIAVRNTYYLYYMSVKHWGAPGKWEAGYAGVAKSTDGGHTWSDMSDVRWPGDSNFIQVAPYQVDTGDGGSDIYFWAVPAGRFGGVKLMKVDERRIEDLSQYRYFAGTGKDGAPVWSPDLAKAVTVIDDTVGELSVIWNPYLERWIMMYLKEGTGIVMREGLTPWGPWNEAITVVNKNDYPGLYAPFLNPKYMENGGKTVYFTMSLWDPYNVFWMKADLEKR